MTHDDHSAAEPAPPGEDVARVLAANHARFLGFLRRRVASEADAEDILQSAFVRGLQKADSLRDGESAVAWFYRLLRNALVDHYRRRGAERRALESLPGAEPSTDDALERVVCDCVRDLAGTLKAEYASALQRVELGGASLKDYAAEVGITANNAAVRVHRARLALRRRVQESCGTCATHGCLGGCECRPGARVHGQQG